MATEQIIPGNCVSFEAAADLSAKQFFIVTVDSAGKCAVAAAGTVAVLGVLQNAPLAGQPASVAIAGVTKLVTGSGLSINAQVVSDSAGKGTVLTVGTYAGTVVNYPIGRGVKASTAADGIAEVVLFGPGATLPT